MNDPNEINFDDDYIVKIDSDTLLQDYDKAVNDYFEEEYKKLNKQEDTNLLFG